MKSICLINKKIKRDKELFSYIQDKMEYLDITKVCKSLIKEIDGKILMSEAEQVNKMDFDINFFRRGIFSTIRFNRGSLY